MGAAREELRQATSGAHRSLDATRLVAGLAAGALSRREYAKMLSVYAAFYHEWEAGIKANFPALVEKAGAFRFEKTRWLQEDLGALEERTAPPALTPPPIPRSGDEAAGALYVVEGSTLGGMHLARGGKLPSGADRFFQGYGEASIQRWRDFVEVLDDLLPDGQSRKNAVSAAQDVFAWFQRGFEIAGGDAPERAGREL